MVKPTTAGYRFNNHIGWKGNVFLMRGKRFPTRLNSRTSMRSCCFFLRGTPKCRLETQPDPYPSSKQKIHGSMQKTQNIFPRPILQPKKLKRWFLKAFRPFKKELPSPRDINGFFNRPPIVFLTGPTKPYLSHARIPLCPAPAV